MTDFVCLLIYEFYISLWKIARCSVILLLPLFMYDNLFKKRMHVNQFPETMYVIQFPDTKHEYCESIWPIPYQLRNFKPCKIYTFDNISLLFDLLPGKWYDFLLIEVEGEVLCTRIFFQIFLMYYKFVDFHSLRYFLSADAL